MPGDEAGEIRLCGDRRFDAESEHEVCVFTLWLNSLDIELAVGGFFEDLKNELTILQLGLRRSSSRDIIWQHVRKSTDSKLGAVLREIDGEEGELEGADPELWRFKFVETTSYVIVHGR